MTNRIDTQNTKELPNVAIFLKRTALESLQAIFSAREPGSLHYDSDDTNTEIFIGDQHTTNLDVVATKPAIIAVRGPVQWMMPIGLGGSSIEKIDIPTGKTTFNDLLTGSVAFSCVSREGIEAENIAHVVFNSFKYFRPVLQKYGYFSIKSLNIGSETLLEQEGSDDKLYVVPVYITALVQDRWTLTDETARKLRQIIIETIVSP